MSISRAKELIRRRSAENVEDFKSSETLRHVDG